MHCVWVPVSPLERLHPQDCAEIYKIGIKENGIYTIQPDLHRPALEVFQIHHTRKTHTDPPPFSSSFRDVYAICGSLKI